MKIFDNIVKLLNEKELTIATMESCTGGALASEITNHPGASNILKFSAVTYSNEYKIKMGVDKDIIDKYSVYSIETAMEMAKNISIFANSDIGVGITGKINNPDPQNLYGNDDTIFISIYEKDNDKYHKYEIKTINESRKKNKEYIIKFIGENLYKNLNENY